MSYLGRLGAYGVVVRAQYLAGRIWPLSTNVWFLLLRGGLVVAVNRFHRGSPIAARQDWSNVFPEGPIVYFNSFYSDLNTQVLLSQGALISTVRLLQLTGISAQV